MRIGELAARTGVSRRSLRYYEQQGLFVSTRSPSGQRFYEDEHVRLVRLIQTFFAAGLTSATVAELLPCLATAPSAQVARDAEAVMVRERDRLRGVVSEMTSAIDALEELIASTARYARRA
ncbi:MerR family transcriptional regulator [Lentzea sp. NPDC058436]|uniref:MerR family transcriptional regulator n=1 Tax=Lentzea sp. NPDC058436 TaxID=3346499 RepID=UPI003646D7DC